MQVTLVFFAITVASPSWPGEHWDCGLADLGEGEGSPVLLHPNLYRVTVTERKPTRSGRAEQQKEEEMRKCSPSVRRRGRQARRAPQEAGSGAGPLMDCVWQGPGLDFRGWQRSNCVSPAGPSVPDPPCFSWSSEWASWAFRGRNKMQKVKFIW